MTLRHLAVWAWAIGLALTAAPARSQGYPTRPVTIVNPFAPGGGTDQMARLVAGKLEQRLGRSFVVENKTGAGSIIAATAVQKAAPDGYTLLMAPSPTMAVNVALYKSLPYEPQTDFIPLALLGQTPFALVVNANLPVKSVADLVAYAKAHEGQMSFGSVGPGVPHHLYMEMFMSMTGIKASHVPYRGSLPALNDVIAGHVQMMFCDIGPSAVECDPGRIRASARHVVAVSCAGLREHSAACRSRRAGLRRGVVADAGRARQDAARPVVDQLQPRDRPQDPGRGRTCTSRCSSSGSSRWQTAPSRNSRTM